MISKKNGLKVLIVLWLLSVVVYLFVDYDNISTDTKFVIYANMALALLLLVDAFDE